ncbi:hypothetical protein FQN57_005179 [Myotisia sp. PD_48]|nr:hypothetical protein FQN57_005179 [Myotisia sp. PD_48]
MDAGICLAAAFRSLRISSKAQCLRRVVPRQPLSSTSQALKMPTRAQEKYDREMELRLLNPERQVPPKKPSSLDILSKFPSTTGPNTGSRITLNNIIDPYQPTEPPHHLHIYSHKHNTHLTLTRPNGEPLLSLSCGNMGFRKSHRGGFDPAHQLTSYTIGKIQEKGLLMGIKQIELVYRGYGPGREAFTKVLLSSEGRLIRERVIRVTDATRLKFGGTRSPRVLLVPITESLVGSRDQETNAPYNDLVASEEFLTSHVLRISNTPSGSSSTGSSLRDYKAKAKQITAINGRTVVVKESLIYCNKGFKIFNQAQLLSDALYFVPPDTSTPWLVYYISKPLVGSFDPGLIIPAKVPGSSNDLESAPLLKNHGPNISSNETIDSFSDLLSRFPMIARQMKPGLDRIFYDFGKELGTPLTSSPSYSSPLSLKPSPNGTNQSPPQSSLNGPLPSNPLDDYGDDEILMRRALENAVMSTIDNFRLVDKQQLSLLGATTELTGPMVERLIERYVSEQVHDALLFPRICEYHRADDSELDGRIRQMENIDVSQVGISIENDGNGKEEVLSRLGKAIDEFRKLSDAKCPQDMLKILLDTVKVLTETQSKIHVIESESKQDSVFSVNADMLVSLLLLTVIRSHLRHLHARLVYMQRFIFIDDVESGESGYVLSTLEAVLTYLLNDSAGLRKASARNKRLWSATKSGNVSEIKSILQLDDESVADENNMDSLSSSMLPNPGNSELGSTASNGFMNGIVAGNTVQDSSLSSGLAHIFPFQNWANGSSKKSAPKTPKKVSMDMRSVSESSIMSYLSHSTVLGSITSGIEGDISVDSLTRTHDPAGHSVPMMAVEACQPGSLSYLLSLDEYYSRENILHDINSDGTTLLSAAVQLGHPEIVDILLNYILQAERVEIAAYLSQHDTSGRTVGHYLFNVPSLMFKLGDVLPWTQRDKNGQTPLFALCRSYDHPDYISMVNQALSIAQKIQGDGRPLRLDDHVDAKGNTLLHVVSDPGLLYRILNECDGDPNAVNDKKFTPLMMASKYGRLDLVRTLFSDPQVDVHIRESRGFTAVELAKDDEVRNKIDDLVLFSNPPSSSLDATRRITTVVRSIFVEDFGIRFIVKSGAPTLTDIPLASNPTEGTMYTITTCRRSIADFESLARLLRIEHPASYIPRLPLFRSPFQVPSKPSRSVLHSTQERLDRFLKILLSHPTFATHELLWEFFLVPEMQTKLIEQRSERKAAALTESIMDDFEPVTPEAIHDIQQILSHAEDAVLPLSETTDNLINSGYKLQNATADFADALRLCTSAISSLKAPTNALPISHIQAFHRFAAAFSASSTDSSPLAHYLATLVSSFSTTTAMIEAISRPSDLIYALNSAKRDLVRSRSAMASSSLPRKFNFSVLEESRLRSLREQESKIAALTLEIEHLSREIAWNKEVVVGELAGWSSWRQEAGQQAIRDFARVSLIREKERGKRLERCLRDFRK